MRYFINFTKCVVILFLCNFSACNTTNPPIPPEPQLPEFEAGKATGDIDNAEIDEASGLVSSLNWPGLLWIHNDSGDKNRVFLIDKKAQWKATFNITGAENRDWEDIAISKFSDGENYIFLGDIGDNEASYNNDYRIYKFKEPKTLPPALSVNTLDNAETIRFKYPDGSHDAETLLIDHQTKDLYVITKREDRVRIYQLPYPQSTTTQNLAVFIGDLPFGAPLGGVPTGATAGDISNDNSEIIIKNYFQIFYWKLKKGENIKQALQRNSDKSLPYTPEPQGEGMGFASDNSGYYTVGESGESKNIVKLYFYKRK